VLKKIAFSDALPNRETARRGVADLAQLDHRRLDVRGAPAPRGDRCPGQARLEPARPAAHGLVFHEHAPTVEPIARGDRRASSGVKDARASTIHA
jgi:hypothetical protein